MTLTQTGKINKVPIILVGSDFWKPLREWIGNTMRDQFHYIGASDLNYMPIVDEPDEVVRIINEFYGRDDSLGLRPTFEL